jgi:hypothetical protein
MKNNRLAILGETIRLSDETPLQKRPKLGHSEEFTQLNQNLTAYCSLDPSGDRAVVASIILAAYSDPTRFHLVFPENTVDAVMALSPEVFTGWETRITGIEMPKGLSILPSWLGQFSNLRALLIADYHPENGNLDATSWGKLELLEIRNSPKVEGIHVITGAKVTCKGSSLHHRVKVICHQIDGSFFVHPVLSHPYYKNPQVTTKENNFNCDARFLDGPKNPKGLQKRIVCRALSTHWILERIKARQQNKKTGEIYQGMTSLDNISQKVPYSVEAQYNYVSKFSKKNYLVNNRTFGQCISDRFFEIISERGDSSDVPHSKYFLMETDSHVMAMELRINPGKPAKYVMAMFDPNKTRTHVREVEISLDAIKENFNLADLFEERLRKSYFQRTTPTVVLKEWCESSESSNDPLGERHLTNYLNEEEKAEPIAINHILGGGFNEELKNIIGTFQKNKNTKFFSNLSKKLGKSKKGNVLGFAVACREGRADAIRLYGESLIQLTEQGTILPQQCFRLLRALDWRGIPGLDQAYKFGNAEVIQVFADLIEKMLLQHWITPDQGLALLSASRKDGSSSFLAVDRDKHPHVIQTVGEIVENWIKTGAINEEEGLAFLVGEV